MISKYFDLTVAVLYAPVYLSLILFDRIKKITYIYIR